jgi:murein DD-endopeptidase MepM/ murein hydrolase activator NlpD
VIGQGVHGASHRDWPEDKEDYSFSIDFLLPIGTEIIAARSGVVTKVKSDGKKNYSGKDSEIGSLAYKEWMNEIEIKHSDGTFASYCHLKNKDSFVKVGDKVKQGRVIGLSGNTGWSSVPHLDFLVIKKDFENYKTKSIKIKFKDYNNSLEDKDIKSSS